MVAISNCSFVIDNRTFCYICRFRSCSIYLFAILASKNMVKIETGTSNFFAIYYNI